MYLSLESVLVGAAVYAFGCEYLGASFFHPHPRQWHAITWYATCMTGIVLASAAKMTSVKKGDE